MPESKPNGNKSAAPTADSPWWKVWQKNQTWRDSLARRAAHKALDISDEDMTIDSSRRGLGALGTIGVALAAGLGPALMAFFLMRQSPVAAPVDSGQEKDFIIKFYDDQGREISVPRFPENLKK